MKIGDKVVCVFDWYNGVQKGEICIISDFWLDDDDGRYRCCVKPFGKDYNYGYRSEIDFKFKSKHFDNDFITLKDLRKI